MTENETGKVVPAVITSGTELITTLGIANMGRLKILKNISNKINTKIV